MKLFIFLLVFLNLAFVQAQEESSKKMLGLSIGYFGETITHQGVSIGLEKNISSSAKYKLILALNGGFYTHKRNNTSIFIRGVWGQRINFNNGLFVENFLGLGYLHHFVHGGKIYEVLPNGAVVEIKNRGDSKFMPSVTLGTGYHFPSSRWSVYIRPELFWKAPFNGYYLTHFALNTGVIFKLR